MNPPKIKTLQRAFAQVPGAVWRFVATLTANAARAWCWLQSHVDGWRFDVEQLAAALGVSRGSAYRACAQLSAVGMLDRGDAVWLLTLPDLPGEIPSLTTETPRGNKDAGACTRAPIQRKTQPKNEHLQQQPTSESVPTPSGVVEEHMTDRHLPTKTPPSSPERHGREAVPEAKRLPSLPRFVEAWRDEFGVDGPARGLVTGSNWNERLLWIRTYWTATELREAFAVTRDAAPRSPWRYYVTLLEKMAAGLYGLDGSDLVPERPTGSRNTFGSEAHDELAAMLQATVGGDNGDT